MTSAKIKHLSKLKRILPRDEVSFETSVLEEHSGDKWFAAHKPDVVVRPRSTKSVSAVLHFANHHHIPLTPRGAGYGYVGGCVPVQGGIVLSFERMNRIKEINGADFIAVAQAGVVTKGLQDAVEKKGLYYPPDPASRAESFIGGNIATKAGGPRCLEYGVTRDYGVALAAVRAQCGIVIVGGLTHQMTNGV